MSYLDSDEEVSPEMLQQYKKAIEWASKADLAEFDRTGLIRSLGKNVNSEEVLLITLCFLTGAPEELEKAMYYCLAKLQAMESQPFVVIVALTLTNWLNDASTFIKNCYLAMPRAVKKNLKQIYLLHWTLAKKMVMGAMSTVVSKKFYDKVVYVDQLSDVLSTLKMPPTEALTRFPYVVQHEEEERISPGGALVIYGSPVATLCARIPTDAIAPYTRLPSIYVDFVEHLTSRDVISTKDLLCLQADCASLYAFVGDIDQGNPFVEWGNIPALVSGFRLLFDCMPVPFLGDKAYSAFCALARGATKPDKSALLTTLTQVFCTLSLGEQETFSYIIKAFKTISNEASLNGMTPTKIAEIFGPSFCRPPGKPDSQIPIVGHLVVEALALGIQDPGQFTPNLKPAAGIPGGTAAAGKGPAKKRVSDSSSSESSSEEESSSESEDDDAKPNNATAVAAPGAAAVPAASSSAAAAAKIAPTPAPAAKAALNRQVSQKRPSSSSGSEESSEEEDSSDDDDDDDDDDHDGE
ncbi:RhoGAP domain-containing protein [Besnoitia besnoiti]|uniref:RhoGAP domain-containing protein n=1 Tax=Besnoitia besnoiti TaxID=94643 RepID=A0A2A9MPB5_BESBE|nr:RhoGAP domain-containing protein [Besnoitia besnoiti]PFH38501.1 RhoGAP domain-containing protein [Besnoitia besnoiti]